MMDYESALQAAHELYCSSDYTLQQALENMNSLKGEIEGMIEALETDIKQEGG